ncbi:hypothetical protein RclHR1_01290009 [Rhizophagus clarus]|uniref:histidine kinase n=1 Tax=Rhizophagus clarus TaxID=94130 RepID=A0A2Z6QA47_9GLOM|nr:hypothetical protein RclHR1_01290009 [Rhizophagus clarus]GES75054.1 two-component system sensor protein [Rhizophagus clarus]
MPSSPSNSSSPTSSKQNSIKSFVRKKFLDTSIFKSKFDKDITNSIQGINNNHGITHRKSIAIPILISNPSKYYKDLEWKTLIKDKFPTTNNDNNNNRNNVSSRRNSAIFRFKPSPKQISIDNVLSSPNNEVDISLLATSPDSDIQFDQYNTDEWKEFLYNYAQGRFDPMITPKKPNSLKRNKTIECRRSKIVCELNSTAEADAITSFIKGLEDDHDQNKSEESKEVNCNYEINCYDDDDADDGLDNNHYLPPPMPPNEVERRRALWRFQILNTSNDVNFARIVALSKEHFKASISMISLLNTTHQWFKAEDGMGCSETTREISFCGHAILQQNGEPFVVLDATKDWRFRNNPLVTDSPFIRFYAGAPLQTEDGYNIGTICVIDREPRDSFSKKDRESLKEFAKVVMRELELWTDTLRLRVRNKMQESIAEFSKFCLEIQLANNSNNEENKIKSTTCDPIMKQCFNMAVKLMRDTLNVDSVYLLEMPCLNSRPLSITSRASSNFFLNAPPPDVPSSHLRSLASAGEVELSSEALKASIITSYFAYLMQAHSQGCIYQNSLPPLPTLFPDDVHSGIVVPIYDNSQNAFGFLIAMTKDSHRQFEDEERVYLSNFGVNVVSEVLKRRVIVADRAKSAFISSISHELRTPLHGILASCELMEESRLNEAQAELVKTIQGCGTSLISIINSVLDFAKLESEKQDYVDDHLNHNQNKLDDKDNNKLLSHDNINNRNNKKKKEQKERIDLVKLIEEVSEACFVGQQMVTAIYNDKITNSKNKNNDDENNKTAITQARKKRVYDLLHPHQPQHQQVDDVLLMIDVEPRDSGWWVMAEDGALKQLLMNIIGNSMKFTKKGYVLISLSSLSYSSLSDQYKKHAGVQDTPTTDSFPPLSNKIHALITITDTGCGISPSFLSTNMFQPFSQENSLQVGTGLGLSIVKLLVEKMGGKLDVESEVGVGTRFRIWLDFDQANEGIGREPKNNDFGNFRNSLDSFNECYNVTEESEEKQRKLILEEIKQKRVIVKCVDGKLKEVVEGYFKGWLKVKELICESKVNVTDNTDGDLIFIIDDIEQLKKVISKVDSKQAPIVFTTTLAKHGKIADFVEKLQREIEETQIIRRKRKVVILTRPCGPRKLEKAIVSVLSSQKEEEKLLIREENSYFPKFIMTPPISDDDNSKDYLSHSSSGKTLSTMSLPPPNINDQPGSDPSSLVPPSRPCFNRSTTLPNLHLSEDNKEPKFLPIPKSNFLLTPSTSPCASPSTSPTAMSTSLPSMSESLNINPPPLNELKKSKSDNSLSCNLGPRVLVVEDNAVNRMILSTFLKKRGIRFDEAENGAIGVEKFRKALEEDNNEYSNRKGFDIILMDIQMPVMNGNVATAEIRKIEDEFNNPKFSLPSTTTTITTNDTTLTKSPATSPTVTTSFEFPPTSLFNKSTPSTPISESNNHLKPFAQKNRFLQRRVSNPDQFSFQNNSFSFTSLLRPKISIKIPKSTTKSKTSPLPSPSPEVSSPTFPIIENNNINNITKRSRSLIFALTGLASEEDKDLAFESGVDGFLTKPVSLKMLEKVLKKWSEKNEQSSENNSVGSSSSSSSSNSSSGESTC